METVGFCSKSANIWQIVGYIFLIIKVIVPVIIIILGSLDFGQAVISGDDKALKEKGERLFKRIVIGIVIFLIPTIIRVLFFNLPIFTEKMKNDAGNCINCLSSPNSCDKSLVNVIFDR